MGSLTVTVNVGKDDEPFAAGMSPFFLTLLPLVVGGKK